MQDSFKPSTIALLVAADKADYIQGKPEKKPRIKKTGYIARGTASRQKSSSHEPINRPRCMWDSIPMLDD